MTIIREKCLRDTMDISDIEGATILTKLGGVHVDLKKPPRDANLNIKDINEYLQFKSTRLTNPLAPLYKIQDNTGKVINYGFIKGSMPK